jgi:hypothetical protein
MGGSQLKNTETALPLTLTEEIKSLVPVSGQIHAPAAIKDGGKRFQ